MDYDWQPYLNVIETTVTRRVRDLATKIVQSKSIEKFDEENAQILVEELNENGTLAIWAAIGFIYERLYRRKGLYFSLVLLGYCVEHCGLKFARHLRKHFMKAMTRLLKLTSLQEQTFVGQVNSQVKRLYNMTKSNSNMAGSSETRAAPKDILLVRCQKKILYLVQLWTEVFVDFPRQVPDMFEAHKKLSRRGHTFPKIDPKDHYKVAVDRVAHETYSDHKLSMVDDVTTSPCRSSTPTKDPIEELKEVIKAYSSTGSSDHQKKLYYQICKKYHPYLVGLIESQVEARYSIKQANSMQNHERMTNEYLDLLIQVENLIDRYSIELPEAHNSTATKLVSPVLQHTDDKLQLHYSKSIDEEHIIPTLPPPPVAHNRSMRQVMDLLSLDDSSDEAKQ